MVYTIFLLIHILFRTSCTRLALWLQEMVKSEQWRSDGWHPIKRWKKGRKLEKIRKEERKWRGKETSKKMSRPYIILPIHINIMVMAVFICISNMHPLRPLRPTPSPPLIMIPGPLLDSRCRLTTESDIATCNNANTIFFPSFHFKLKTIPVIH